MSRRYSIYDVFTDRPFAGNPLAVVHDTTGLGAEQMQAVAREFNLSETTFLEPSGSDPDRIKVRIFTPAQELPFAGHPTIGSAVAYRHGPGRAGPSSAAGRDPDGGTSGPDGDAADRPLVLEEGVGPVEVEVSVEGGRVGSASFRIPSLPRPFDWTPDPDRLAVALGIDASDIGFGEHGPSAFDAGLPYFMVPVSGLDVMRRLRPNGAVWDQVFKGGANHDSAYVYCRETVSEGSRYHARMFWPVGGIREDPATGSAAASFLGAFVSNESPGDGIHRFVIEQGIEMGRPSFLRLEAETADGDLVSGRIGGHAVRVGQGYLED